LPGHEKKRSADEWTDPCRDAEHRRRGQRVQAPASLDVGDTRRLRGNQLIAQPDFLAQLDRFRFLNQQRIRASVDRESVHRFAEDDAAGAWRAFQYHERHLSPGELVTGGKAGDAAADDRDVNGAGARDWGLGARCHRLPRSLVS
jgi:hypothetical protein